MTGITREKAAALIAGMFGTDAVHVGGVYGAYSVRDSTERQWKVVSDSSIDCERRPLERMVGREYAVEVVSPICTYEDIKTIQKIVRILREAGAIVNKSCGIHVHVDASRHTAKTLRNLVNIMAAKEELLYKTLRVHVRREDYCKKVNTRFLDALNRLRPQSLQDMENIWYNGNSRRRSTHYDGTRYHALNLHSVFNKGTIEFRLFNSTLHAGEVKAYIQLCLAISHQALMQTRASPSRTHSDNEKYTFRTWLLRLGLIGKEFESARMHLLKNLEGNIAWRDPAQATRQKERLAAKRLSEPQAPPAVAAGIETLNVEQEQDDGQADGRSGMALPQ